MKKNNKILKEPIRRQTVDAELPELSRIAHKSVGFTVLEDKVIIICDRSFAERLLDRRHDKALPPS